MIYSIGRRTTDTTLNNATFDLGCAAGARGLLMELGFALATGVASVFGLNRPTATGTRTSPVALLAEDPAAPTSEVDSALAWSVQPSFASEYLRRIGLPATVGAGVIWTFPRGIVIAQSATLALRNLAAGGLLDVYAVVDE